jgi:hypothetical protein
MYTNEGKSLSQIQDLLTKTADNFKKLGDKANSEDRNKMIKQYFDFTTKRIKDLETIKNSYKQLNINNNDVRNN